MQENDVSANRAVGALYSKSSPGDGISGFFWVRTLILLAICALFLSEPTYAQQNKSGQISFGVSGGSLTNALKKLQTQSGYSIFYPSGVVSGYSSINLPVKSRTVSETLDLLLSHANLAYRIEGKKIIISEKRRDSTTYSQTAEENSNRLFGIVLDENQEPLAGATIQIIGNSRNSAASDLNGHFNIEFSGYSDKVKISYIGFESQTWDIPTSRSLKVNLLPNSNKGMNEVVVIGYGTTTKKLNTGSVSSISGTALSNQTVTNPLTALQGRIPGVQITQDNGLAGGGVRVQIRGLGSASSGFIPLYVIDGVPFTLFNGGSPASDNLNAYGISGANGGVSPFSMINPDDIERIDVLKDADATAIYGARGANGVVLITTKKGSRGNTTFNLNAYQGWGKVNHFIDMMDTKEYLQMRRDAFAFTNTTPTASNAPDLMTWDTTQYTDWQKWAIGGTSHSTHVSLGVSGGNAQTNFMFSSTYHREGTVYPGDYSSTSFSNRLTASHTSQNSKFNINTTVNYAFLKNNLPSVDISSLYSIAPDFPLYNANGTLNWTITNPLSYLMITNNAQTNNLIANVTPSYKILPELQAKVNLGYSSTSLKQTTATPARAVNSTATTSNRLQYADNKNDNYIVEPQLSYTPTIGGNRLQVLVGSTFQQNKSTGISMVGTGFASESLIQSLASASTVTVSYNNYSLYKYTSVFGRANYNIREKYLLDFTFRRDASSRFGPGNRWGTFGALGAAWIFSKEAFLSDNKVLSFGKLRASYGYTGNDQIPNYQYNALYTSGSSSYSYLGTSVLVPGTIANSGLHWETNKKLDVGIDLGFLQDRITLTADYYRNRSSDQLVYIPVAGQSGINSYMGNLNALVQNRGFEIDLNATVVKTKSIQWRVGGNVTFNNNKLLDYPGLATSSNSTSYIVGYPLTLTQLYKTNINPATGIPVVEDLNNDGSITTADRTPAYVGTPYYGGLNTTFTWKNLTLDIAFQFNHRYGYINSTLASAYNPAGYTYTNQTADMVDRWRVAGDSKLYPAASTSYLSSYYNFFASDVNWGNTSYVKFKTLSLTYALPSYWTRKAGIKNASVYFRGQNLFTWAKQKYTYDPETTVPGTGSGLATGNYIAYPQLRVLTIGLNLSF